MPRAEFFLRFGLFVRRHFLDAAGCARLCAEMQEAHGAPATVWTSASRFAVDDATRRTTQRKISAETTAFMQDRLCGVLGELGRHFDVKLAGCQTPGFLAYAPGDFYRPHRDNGGAVTLAPMIRQRRISTVVFLNEQITAGGTGHYGGGALTFYGLLDEPRLATHGFPLEGETGMMVAFPANLVHAVAPVTAGVRYTVVTWFFETDAP